MWDSASGKRLLKLEAHQGEARSVSWSPDGTQLATSGMDAKSLGSEPGHIVLSTQKATVLGVAVVVLLALSFAAGFLIASR